MPPSSPHSRGRGYALGHRDGRRCRIHEPASSVPTLRRGARWIARTSLDERSTRAYYLGFARGISA